MDAYILPAHNSLQGTSTIKISIKGSLEPTALSCAVAETQTTGYHLAKRMASLGGMQSHSPSVATTRNSSTSLSKSTMVTSGRGMTGSDLNLWVAAKDLGQLPFSPPSFSSSCRPSPCTQFEPAHSPGQHRIEDVAAHKDYVAEGGCRTAAPCRILASCGRRQYTLQQNVL